jgi:hypothetical protein
MANLKTKNVFLDTEVFEASNFNFSSRSLGELLRLAQADRVNVFLTNITLGEVQAHIVEKIDKASGKLKQFRNEEGRILQNVAGYEAISAKVDKPKCIDEVKGKFQEFLENAKATVIGIESVKPEGVFRDYFDLKPPFGEGRKKEEFPDAFAQQALMDWCESNHTEMYVISANKDWHCQKNYLIPLTKLDEFVDAAVRDEAGEEFAERILEIYQKHLHKVEKAIKEAFEGSEFYTSDVDGDVDEVNITTIIMDEPLVLEVNETLASISVDVEVEYVADVSYLNDDAGIWDGEDHVWAYRPTVYLDAKESDHFEAELEVQYDLKNEDEFDVSCNIKKTFSVTALPTSYELK